jgi:hypothetical protein
MVCKNRAIAIVLSGINLILLTGISHSCAFKIQKHFLAQDDIIHENREGQTTEKRSPCSLNNSYRPATNRPADIPKRYVRLNFHIIQDTGRNHTFNRKLGRSYVKLLVKNANETLTNNQKMVLPKGNTTPVLPLRFEYKLAGRPGNPEDDGIYFHEHETLWRFVKQGKHRNTYSRQAYKKFGVRKGGVINIFLLEHHPDSVQSSTYKASGDGVGFSNFVKTVGCFQHLHRNRITEDGTLEPGTPVQSNLLNHELGHSLGLSHTWNMGDGCDDTPRNQGCWMPNLDPPCDKEYTTNNVMDYNHRQDAYTPCQIGKIQKNFARIGSPQRKKLEKNWCSYKSDSTVFIGAFEDVVWQGHRDLEGDIIINNQGSLTIHCRVHLPKSAKIIVKPKAKLVLDGATITNLCGDKWQGIEVWENQRNEPIITFQNDASLEHLAHPFQPGKDQNVSK